MEPTYAQIYAFFKLKLLDYNTFSDLQLSAGDQQIALCSNSAAISFGLILSLLFQGQHGCSSSCSSLAKFWKTTIISNYRRVYYEDKTWKSCVMGHRNASWTRAGSNIWKLTFSDVSVRKPMYCMRCFSGWVFCLRKEGHVKWFQQSLFYHFGEGSQEKRSLAYLK